MEKIKELIDQGELELATADKDNSQTLKYDDLKQKVDFRNHMAQITKQLNQKSLIERRFWIDDKRNKGNQLFNEGKFEIAVDVYLESLVGIDYNWKNAKQQYQYPILLNMATCFYHSGEYNRGAALCETILKQNRNHIMANFKKGCLLIKLGQYDSAKICFGRANKTDSQKLKGSIQFQLGLIKKYKGEQSDIYKKMFNKEKQDSTQEDDDSLLGFQENDKKQQEIKQIPKGIFQQFISLICPHRHQKTQ